MPSDAPKLTLVSHHLCPYVQRAAIALAEKGVAFERRYIDLADKPAWFRAISPLGKVPVLIVPRTDGPEAVLFESAVICEFIEDSAAGPKLHPEDALERAKHRAWMEFGSAVLSDIWRLETATDATAHKSAADAVASKLAWIERDLGEGPYFSGNGFSMVDAVFAPAFRYFDVFDRIADIGVFAAKPKVRAWRAALAERPSVRGAVTDDYGKRLQAFLVQHNAHLIKLAA
ncbi:glutathione S-transferase family protein [Undibacter mobilis]|uniref:glutathione transferase n=1 Tax=Undibacter mobilis TaxID=2292256 RepID=A0A371BC06_9BRAD|nr:glutathione S-transferase family protein [Undibacter mobilis]RDV05102.1 glutathione S-transferase family protein [Undibacter mobilis]